MAEKLKPFYSFLEKTQILTTSDLKGTFDSVNKALGDASGLTLKQPNPGKQIVHLTDASFRRAGSDLMIDVSPGHRLQPKRRGTAPYRPDQKSFPL